MSAGRIRFVAVYAATGSSRMKASSLTDSAAAKSRPAATSRSRRRLVGVTKQASESAASTVPGRSAEISAANVGYAGAIASSAAARSPATGPATARATA